MGGKLAGSLVRNGFDTVVHDLDRAAAQDLLDKGAGWADTPRQMAETCDVVITCLPSPQACSDVMEGPYGILHGLSGGKVWMEMSTTDAAEVERMGARVRARGALPAECPVSGGCHRADTGNISIFVGGDRDAFETVLPLTSTLGRRVLHTGPLGTASTLKVMTNYLATANLLTCCEALITMKAAGMDMATTYEAMKISSGTSFVHETESQLILNGARDVNFTLDLILKDIGLFQTIAERNGVPLELSPMIIDIMKDGQYRYGTRANTDDIIGRLEEATGLSVLAEGFPAELVDTSQKSGATRWCRPGPTDPGDADPRRAARSAHPRAPAPDTADERCLVCHAHAQHIAAPARLQPAPVREPRRARGVFAHAGDGAGQIVPAVCEPKGRQQQRGGHVIGGDDVEQVASASSAAATLPECEPPRMRLGAPIITASPRRGRPRRLRASWGTRRTHAIGPRCGDLLRRRVVMAGEHRAEPRRLGHGPGFMLRAKARLQLLEARDMLGELIVIVMPRFLAT